MKNKIPFARHEKRMLWWSSGICLLALSLGGLYEWNNRVPTLRIPQATPPLDNAYDHYARAAKAYVAPIITRKGMAPDGVVDNYAEQPPLFSAAYRARYPLAGQRAFLRANATTLGEIKAGLKLDYLQPPERGLKSQNGMEHRTLARLLLVESHARAGVNDWDGAAQSLLDIQHMGVQSAHGGALRVFGSSLAIRKMAHDDFWRILPHLSAAKARDAARQLEKTAPVEPAKALGEEKRATQSAILGLIRGRDWRPLYVSYGCIDIGGTGGCDISEEQYQHDLYALPALLKMRLAWMNKPALLEEYTRYMDWQIARMRQPYSPSEPVWLFPEPGNDGVEQLTHPRYSMWNAFTTEAQDRLLTTALALHAYRKDRGSYPRTLLQLVPNYLARVPLDPYGDGLTLLYAPRAKKYVVGFDVVPAPPGVAAPGADIGPEVEPPKIYSSQPYTLWSRGLDARDDGGKSCVLRDQVNLYRRYRIEPSMREAQCDIVAGINH